jgi:hypothetical protein
MDIYKTSLSWKEGYEDKTHWKEDRHVEDLCQAAGTVTLVIASDAVAQIHFAKINIDVYYFYKIKANLSVRLLI